MRLDEAVDVGGAKSEGVMRLAFLNAHFQTGLSNPLDDAVNSCAQELGLDAKDERKIGEIPYDFTRKRLSVITADPKGEFTLVTKGALDELLEVCSQYQKEGRAEALDQAQRAVIEKEFSDWSERGFRVLGVASKTVSQKAGSYSTADERDLTLAGFLLFFDPPKKDVRQVIADLEKRGVEPQDHNG